MQDAFFLRDAEATIGLWIRGEDYRFALLVAVLQRAMDEFDIELLDSTRRTAFVALSRTGVAETSTFAGTL